MIRAALAGVGMVPFAKMPEKTLADIGWPAVKAAIADAGIDSKALQAC